MTVLAAIACIAGFAASCQKRVEPRWPQDANVKFPATVLIGDSITARWYLPNTLNHGIGGQQTVSMVKDFRTDALRYQPSVVVIEGGFNDFNAGRSADSVIQNYVSMYTMAKQAGVKVMLSTIVPFGTTPNCGIDPANQLKADQVNTFIRSICSDDSRCRLLDYAQAMGPFKQSNYVDCVHPNQDGYAIMEREYNLKRFGY